MELGTADAGVPLAHPAPRSWWWPGCWWQVTGTGACLCRSPGWALWGHLRVGVSPAGGHGWVWGTMGGWVAWQCPPSPCTPVVQEGRLGVCALV